MEQRAAAANQRLVEFLTAERRRRKVRQTELARRLRRSQTWVARTEAGKRRIAVDEFLSIAHVLGFDPVAAIRAISRAS
jgi:transcriptional regulator with XRE-family HTH domain